MKNTNDKFDLFSFEYELAKNDGSMEEIVALKKSMILNLINDGNKDYEKKIEDIIREKEELTLKYNLAKYYSLGDLSYT